MAIKKPTVDLELGTLVLRFPYHPSYVNQVRLLPGARWDPSSKAWRIPSSAGMVRSIKAIFPTVEVGPGLRLPGDDAQNNAATAAELKYLPKYKDVEVTDFDFKTKPYWHQRVSFNFARALPQAGLLLDPRLGKSKILVDLWTWRFRKRQMRRGLVVCPNTVTTVWPGQVAIHSGDDFCRCEVLEGSCLKKVRQCELLLRDDFSGYVVVNYDALLGMFDGLMALQRDPRRRLFDAMGLDESSRIKHATSQRSKKCWRLGQTVDYRSILTGTPITQSLEDVFGQYKFLQPSIFGVYATAFRAQYLLMGGFENRQIVGYRNIDDALKKVYSVSIRFTADRCLDLPKKVYEKRTVRLDDVSSRKYRTLEKECVAEFGGSLIMTPQVMTRRMKLSQITGGFIYEAGEDGKRVATHRMSRAVKLDALRDIIEELPGKKFIVWCTFTEELKLVRELLDSMGVKHVYIAGDVKVRGKSREGACDCGACRECCIRQFQEDPSTLGFAAQMSTANMGITLSMADFMVYYSCDCNLENRLQTEERPIVIGRRTPVLILDILAETSGGGETVDHDTNSIWTGKNRFATEISRALMARMMQRNDSSGRDLSQRVNDIATSRRPGYRQAAGNKHVLPTIKRQPDVDILSSEEEF